MEPRVPAGVPPRLLARLAGPAVLLALLAVLLVLTAFLAGDYIQRIVIIIGINVILVVGLNLSNGFTGMFSLGHVGFMAIGAYTAALLTLPVSLKAVNLPNLPAWLGRLDLPFLPATLIGGLAAAAVAFLVGLSLMRLNGAYISVATLGFLVIVQVILVNWDQVTRGARTFAGVPPYSTIWNVCSPCTSCGAWAPRPSGGPCARAGTTKSRPSPWASACSAPGCWPSA
jgi:branched-chain amino acid transport system permease protein